MTQSDQRETAAEELHGNRFRRRGGLEANGGVIGFNYQNAANLTDNQSTQLLVIQTNATSLVAGLMSAQDELAANGVGYCDSPNRNTVKSS